MVRRTHPAAVSHALEQELFEQGEAFYKDEDRRREFNHRQRLYIGSVNRGKRTIHYWWIHATEELMTIDEGPYDEIITVNLENPVKRIPQRNMTAEELEQAGEFTVPASIMRAERYLSEMGAKGDGPLAHRACDLLLPLLGITIVPESDAEIVKIEHVDWGVVRFYCPSVKES